MSGELNAWSRSRRAEDALVPLAEIKKAVVDAGGDDESLREFRCAVILLSAWSVGTNAIRLSQFTGYDRHECVMVGIHMRRNGWWKGGAIHDRYGIMEPRDAIESNTLLALDAMLCAGTLRYNRRNDTWRTV